MMNSENSNHNTRTLLSLSPGDLVQFDRGLYSHWGVYIGNGKIVHLTGVEGDGIDDVQAGSLFSIGGRLFDKARVCEDMFWNIVGADKAHKNNTKDEHWRALDPDMIVKKALSKLGEVGYNVIYENCEHFAKWCRYEKKHSQQKSVGECSEYPVYKFQATNNTDDRTECIKPKVTTAAQDHFNFPHHW